MKNAPPFHFIGNGRAAQWKQGKLARAGHNGGEAPPVGRIPDWGCTIVGNPF
ncbi:MAG: hypothetical protein M3Y27_06320 [Acidobacteriota bacterium]|nr:hypothetical protein [Acidobacteriota bacterium]